MSRVTSLTTSNRPTKIENNSVASPNTLWPVKAMLFPRGGQVGGQDPTSRSGLCRWRFQGQLSFQSLCRAVWIWHACAWPRPWLSLWALFKIFYSVVDLQRCASLRCAAKWISCLYTRVHILRLFPDLGHYRALGRALFPVPQGRSLLLIYYMPPRVRSSLVLKRQDRAKPVSCLIPSAPSWVPDVQPSARMLSDC